MEEVIIGRGEFLSMSTEDKGSYTVEDIEALPEGQRAELFDGEMVMLASPSTTHQELLMWLSVQIYNRIKSKGGKCKVFPAPFAVMLKNDNRNYLEPDISVICDLDKMDEKGCHGAPDWVVEIVSPSSISVDYYRKLEFYHKAGVREYWIVDYEQKSITVYNLEQEMKSQWYDFKDIVKSHVFGELSVDFSEFVI